jgi:group I intron endonuclease
MASCGIYCITNKLNKKFYLGSSNNIERRFYRHVNDLKNNKHSNCHLQRSWNKYGVSAFGFSIVRLCSVSDLLVEEQKDLDKYVGTNLCYNQAKVAGQPVAPGENRSDEVKRKISMAQIGIPRWTDEQKKQMSINRMGHRHSPETLIKFANRPLSCYTGIIKAQQKNVGRRYSSEHALAISNGKRIAGKRFSAEELHRIKTGVTISYATGKCKKNKVPKEEYNTIKNLYLSGTINKRQLAFRYGITPSSMQKLLQRIQ